MLMVCLSGRGKHQKFCPTGSLELVYNCAECPCIEMRSQGRAFPQQFRQTMETCLECSCDMDELSLLCLVEESQTQAHIAVRRSIFSSDHRPATKRSHPTIFCGILTMSNDEL